jgi:sugar lactone lactonase YvrE
MVTVGSRCKLFGVGLLTLALTALGASTTQADFFVSNSGAGVVGQYNETTGDLIKVFASGVSGARGIVWGPDGNLYVASDGNNNIVRFDKSGQVLGVFVQGPELSGPRGIIFDSNGNLYVSSKFTHTVERYDANGKSLGSFVPARSGGLSGPRGLLFGPDGNLYVGSYDTGQVLRYDGTTGAFIDVFADGGLNTNGFTFGPDGNLYVSKGSSATILQYDGGGQYLKDFVALGSSPIGDPNGVLFGPDGNLYVCDLNGGGALRYNGRNGNFIDFFVNPGRQLSASYMTFSNTDPTTLNYVP